jgi:glyoxylase-like metal-dependent hydrolase (beta-lactamase superfamily II)
VTEFAEVAADVFVMRYPVLDVNATLVVGDGAALVVDTLSTEGQAVELAEAVRRITLYPWTLVNTHHHFDHCFGNAVLAGSSGLAIWAHEEAAAQLRDNGKALQREWYKEYTSTLPELADGLAAVTVLPPNRTIHLESTLDIGGRSVVLRHLGRGHTAGDLVVQLPDVNVVLAGDLIEESGPPSFGDAYPLDWPHTLAALLPSLDGATVVVPGHGAVVDRAFVQDQHRDLTAFEWLIRDGHCDGVAPEKVAPRSPFGAEASLVAVRRGYAELSGRA